MHRDVSGWETRLDDKMVAQYTQSGKWTGETLVQCARRCAREHPERSAAVDDCGALSFSEALERALRLADALRSRGLRPGHVISFQLPNWHETLIINLAASIGGFVCNPIVPIYRDSEVSFILRNSHTRILFIPETFRSTDYVEMIERLRPQLPELEEVVLVRASREGYGEFSRWLEGAGPVAPFPDPDPNAVKLLLYTSGTTGDPKGVLHSHNTLRAEINAVIGFWRLTTQDVLLMPSPVTHITGYLYGLEVPFALGMEVVLMERWSAGEAYKLIEKHQVTWSVGATPFLVELVAEVDRQSRSLPSLRMYSTGGAPVPPEVVRRAAQVLPNCLTFRAYGSSEAPTVALGVPVGDPAELGAITDGAVCNHEVRIVDAVNGATLSVGQEGEIITRGPEVMLGYTNPEYTRESFDAEGFFHTGDLGHLDDKGYITVSGRKKDIIIRGGENISSKEIEDVLHQHPAILEAAVVAMPHPRMGETPCAYVVLRPDMALDFATMTAFLEQAKLARQKFPERLFILEELPHTASGKVLKHVLRARSARDAMASPH